MSFDYFGRPTFQLIKYLTLPFSVDNPWLVAIYTWGGPVVIFEGQVDDRRQVFSLDGITPINISVDESADYGNPAGLFNPIITSDRTKGTLRRHAFWFNGVLVVAREGPADSSLVIWPGGYSSADTLKGPGANRNTVVGSPWIPQYPWAWVPVVWANNRTGRWHLYGTFARLSIDDVAADRVTPVGFSLAQNFPNPFNPTTEIQFTIVNRQLTIVMVYDILGNEVTTLVNEVKGPGTYTVRFNGSNLSSGVYLFRLAAGTFVQTRKLVLIR
jgi:hypothetical protein